MSTFLKRHPPPSIINEKRRANSATNDVGHLSFVFFFVVYLFCNFFFSEMFICFLSIFLGGDGYLFFLQFRKSASQILFILVLSFILWLLFPHSAIDVF